MKYFLPILSLLIITFSPRISAQSLVITEIMYNVPGSDTLEYIELYNNSGGILSLNGYTFTNGIVFDFPDMQMAAEEFLVLARDADAVNNAFGISAMQWTSGGLNNGGEAITIRDNLGLIADTVRYRTIGPWPTGPINPDGDGASIVLCNPFLDNNIGSNWIGAGENTGVIVDNVELLGHPGSGCPLVDISPPIPFNAIAYQADEVTICFNEIVNASAENSANYSGLGNITNAVLPNDGDKVVLSLQTPLQDFVPTDITIQNVQDATGNPMTGQVVLTVTWIPGGPTRDLVISEINYNPPDTSDILEFIEIYNNSGQTLNLFETEISDGIDFVFPDFELDDGEFVVVANDAFSFNEAFGFTPFEWTDGNLNNGGERIAITNHVGFLVDEVDYGDMDDENWPDEPDGGGASLSLCPVWADNADEANWIAATTPTGVMVEMIEIFANPGVEDTSCGVNVTELPESQFVLYPNPANDQVFIEMEIMGDYELVAFDLVGRRIFSEQFSGINHEVTTSDLSAGTYWFRIAQSDDKSNQVVKKLVILK
ncbi:MAG: lamin tail domain-containing protein [Bacteroidota bacterium]